MTGNERGRNKLTCRGTAPLLPVAAVCAAVVAGCAAPQVPDTSPSHIQTIVAGTFAAAMASASPTPRPPTATYTATPIPPTATETPGPPVRIRLLADATTANLTGRLRPRQVQSFVLRGVQGRPLLVRLASGAGDAAISIKTQGGTSLLAASPGRMTWRGTLPQTGEYYIDLHGGEGPADYTLTVQIAEKITFKEGAASAVVKGQTVDGTVMAYSVLGVRGKEMEVGLSGVGEAAALSVYGSVDGKMYLSAEDGRIDFTLELPKTQDYIVEVVPKAGQVLNYSLAVLVQ